LVVQAAVRGDRDEAFRALCAHPLGPMPDRAESVLEDMLRGNRPYLPQFFDRASSKQSGGH
jgi:6-phospho-beta-glucosidase